MKAHEVDLLQTAAAGRDAAAGVVRFGADDLRLLPETKAARSSGRTDGDGARLLRRAVPADRIHLVVQVGNRFEVEHPDIPVLYRKGRYLVVELSKARRAKLREHRACYTVQRLAPGTTVFDVAAPSAARAGRDPRVEELLQQLSLPRMRERLEFLAAFPTRVSTSAHFQRAAEWARDQFRTLGYAADLVPILLRGRGRTANIIASGRSSAASDGRIVLVTAHLDSVNGDGGAASAAPGADDNASGASGVLEIASALQHASLGVELRFILFGGEEQGLFGSEAYVEALSAAERARIAGVVNMDMIGTINGTPRPTVLIEGGAISQPLIDGLARAANTYTDLAVQTSLNPYNSDHVPFIRKGIPAVLLIEGTDSANDKVHTANDTVQHIDYGLMSQILAMHTAFISELAGFQKGTHTMTSRPAGTRRESIDETRELLAALRREASQYSGVYTFNDGVARTGLDRGGQRSAESAAALRNPIYRLDEPVFLETPANATRSDGSVRFTLRLDIDGEAPLRVVSGSIESASGLEAELPQHFIGRVNANTATANGRRLIVGEFRFKWPETGDRIDRIDVDVTGTAITAPIAEVTFVDTAHDRRFGPFIAERSSTFFHDVEVDLDREAGALPVEPLSTHTHPDRPSDLPLEDLTLESAFARAGIRITRSTDDPAPVPSPPGHKWDYSELHDSMVQHWEAFANRPQWKMWILLAERADDDGLGGVMFDGDIDEPGGVDRQGTALFTLCPFFHTAAGAYAQANPPHDEAVKRELFFNLIHETGHAFNLAHSFQKQAGHGWTPPTWSPLTSNAQAMSWMNYPDQANAALSPNATWFYQRFRFRFDEGELLFLRHAPESYVQMGAKAWFDNHGRVSRDSVDPRLELSIRTRRRTNEDPAGNNVLLLGEPVMLELKLRNRTEQPLSAHGNLDPSDGLVEIGITNPRGERRPFLPIDHTRSMPKLTTLDPRTPAVYAMADVTMGAFGFHFKEPGAYRIEASYTNLDGRTAAAVLQLYVEPPSSYAAVPIINELFDAKVGRTLYVEGTRSQGGVNDKLQWITDRLSKTIGRDNPIAVHLQTARWKPLAKVGHYIDRDNKCVTEGQQPDEVVRALEGVLVDRCESAADTMGHIWYRQVVDTYTDAAEAAGRSAKAAAAQKAMLDLFTARKVVEPVLQSVQMRAAAVRRRR